MTEENQPIGRKLKQGLSRTLMFVGAAGFLLGDRFLHEMMHVNPVAAEVIGIGGGIVVVLIGAALADSRKSVKTGEPD